MGRKRIDVFDLLPEEAIKAIDIAGYEFLRGQGFLKEGEGAKDREKIARRLKRKCATLEYDYRVKLGEGVILFWFSLDVRGKAVAKSQAIKFVVRGGEGNAGTDKKG